MLRHLFFSPTKLLLLASILIVSVLFEGKAEAQTVIYTQDFGTTSHAALPTGWVASGPEASNISLNNTNPSVGYTIFDGPSASGRGQLEDGQGTPAIGTALVTVSGVVSTVGYTGITLQYAAYMSAANIEDPGLTWSSDGVTWNPISYTPPIIGSATWTLINASPISLPASAAGQSNLRFQFTFVRTTTGGSYRIDDFTVEGIACTAPTITGTTSLTMGTTTMLSDATTGGTWSSGSTAVATVSATGVVYSVSPGTATIIYTLPSGCTTGAVVTVYAMAGSPITGSTTACIGSSTTLSDASAGAWSSGSPTVATVDGSGHVYGVSPGTSVITFAFTGGGSTTATVTVVANPVAGAISGLDTVCISHTVTLADASTSGVWGGSNGSATVSGGVVTGITSGTDTIFYVVSNVCGADTANHVMIISDCVSAVAYVSGNAGYKMIISPNPNQGSFTILLSSLANEPAQITITNILGEKIKEYTVATNQETAIQLNAPAGMYFLTAISGAGMECGKVLIR